jgi:L-rhamnose mutarotase
LAGSPLDAHQSIPYDPADLHRKSRRLAPCAEESPRDRNDPEGVRSQALQQEIARQGIAEISLFQLDDMIFLYSRVNDPEAWTRLWDSDVHRRWGELMSPLMHYRDDGIIDSRELREIWHFTPDATG